MGADHPGAFWHPSPNSGPRRGDVRPDMIVLHHTAMTTAEAALERLCDPSAEVSAHYLIAEDGRLWQLVPEALRAWHAGAGHWGDVADVNSRSIGIELANPAPNPFSDPQMTRLEALLPAIMKRWQIPPERIIGHSDMAPGRKADPGPKFDWRRLALLGLSVWPESGDLPGPEAGEHAQSAFLADLGRIGYRLPEGAAPTLLLEVFRMRFRPWGQGPLEEEDCRIAAALARHWPCAISAP